MMYNELIKQLKELASLPEHCENIADCDIRSDIYEETNSSMEPMEGVAKTNLDE